MKFLSLKRAHLVGIKGQGMTALAEVLSENGVTVTGSDTPEVFTTDPILKKLGIPVSAEFAGENIPAETETVIYSTAYNPDTNPELVAARERKIPLQSYPEALGSLTREKMTLAVCGTHGKTTTSALLAECLREAGLDPIAIIGSQINGWLGNALSGKGDYFVLEADEYQNKLKYYNPFGVILTSADWDHPDFFPTVESYEKCFEEFIARIPRHGFLVACGDSAAVKRIASHATSKTLFYGFHPECDIRISHYSPIDPESEDGRAGFFQRIALERDGAEIGSFRLRLSGRHNALNAAAVVSVLRELKVPFDEIVRGLEGFAGTKRRFERIGERSGALIFDDYAHHPEEIKATLSAMRDLYPEARVKVIFHPHTFTRTKALLQEFSQSFEQADAVYLLDIYGSARETQGGVSSKELADLMNKYARGKALWAPDREKLIEEMENTMEKGDIILTMGAGDVWQIAEKLAHKN